MKKIYTLIFIVLFQILNAQNPTAPTGTSEEVGETKGQLAVSLSGAATYNIPIEVPPGLNGVVPQISLNYNSQSGNGIAGYGWNIGGLSAITRIPSTIFHDGVNDPVDFDSLDRFALDGQRLIVKAGTTGVYGANGTVYETEIFSNVRITSFGVHPSGANYGPAWFKVEYPDGSWAEFGNTNSSRSIMTWGLNYWQNPQSISIVYSYYIDQNTLYIVNISYGSTLTSSPYNQIRFFYNPRSRNEQTYINGENIMNSKILSNITTGLKVYLLNYQQTPLKYQKLNNISEINADASKNLNPIVFDYADSINPTEFTSNSNTLISQNINATTIEKAIVGDFNGDNNSDYIFIPKMILSPQLPTTYSLFDGAISNSGLITTVSEGYKDIFSTTFLNGNSSTGIKSSPTQGWTVITDNIPTYTYSTTDVTINFKTYSYNILAPTTVTNEQTKQFTPPNQACTVRDANGFVLNKPYIKHLNGDFNGDGITDVITILAGQADNICGVSTVRKINELFLLI